MSFKIFLVVLAASELCFAQEAYQEEAIGRHNLYRAWHGSGSLEYDADLEAQSVKCAEKYASGELVPHECSIDGVGENVWRATNFGNVESNCISSAIQSWYDENSKYNYDDPSTSSGYLHFTQLVWKDTTKIGCGVAFSGNKQAVVCSYSPQGNVLLGGDGVDAYQFFKANVLPPK